MLLSTTPSRPLTILATACLLSVALPTGGAFAQKTKTKPPAVEQTESRPETSFVVEVPNIDAVGSNIDTATLRSIFSGNVVENSEALAGLTAASIDIPTITIEGTSTIDGEVSTAVITFTDITLSDVTDGVASTVSVSGVTMDAEEQGTAAFGALSATNLDIGGVLRLYGLVDAAGQTELTTLYTNFAFEGGTIESPEISCTIGAMNAEEYRAKPFGFSFTEIMALSEQLENQDSDPSPEAVGRLLRMYADIFTSFETSRVDFDGFDCAGTDDEGRAMSFSVAGMSMDPMKPGIYPSITFDGLDVTVEDDGQVSLGSFTLKEMDLSGPIAAIRAAPEAIDEAWFTANARALIPAFAGFSFSDVVVDVPDPDSAGQRIKASLGAFDLTLGAYVNGIPTDLLTRATNIVVDLPEDSEDEQLQQLIALGVTTIDAGFAVDASWNPTDETISIDEISVTGADLATIYLAGTLANASSALFSLDENEALASAMGVAVANLKLDIADAGLSDLILTVVAAEQGSDPAAMRPIFAGLAQGSVIGFLAGAAEAQKVGEAINAFVSGNAKHLTIDLAAKEPPGLGMMDFMAAEEDPASLIGKVTIDASAE